MSNPKIFAAYGVRWEPQFLVDDLRENLSWVDGFVEIDNRGMSDDEPWGDENVLYKQQRDQASEAGADWLLVTAPDERWDKNAETIIRERLSYLKRTILRCPVRSLYTPTKYRSDRGFWRHEESRIFPLLEDFEYDNKSFHNNIAPTPDAWTKRQSINVPIYDLKSIEPKNREIRVAMYKATDPTAEMTVLKSYDDLLDIRTMQFTDIKEPYGYNPPYTTPYYFNPPENLYRNDVN
jgi:hypothetical protein